MTPLEVAGLSVRRADGRDLVRDLSFSLAPGERLGLIGESGSGKSLTALAVMGLLPAGMTAHGSVLLDGTQMVGTPDRKLNRVRGRAAAVVFQEPLTALDPLMRVGRQLAWPIRRRRGLRGAALRAAVQDALAEVRLPERVAAAYPHEISGGQRQRAAIAMALACEPAVLIADEPTTALDVTVQSEVLALLDGLVAGRGMALLFITHDLAVVADVADRVVVLKDGSMVESGRTRDIVREPRHAYTRSLVDSAWALEGELDRLAP
ncbi:ATP-binding cassette domain-containing protein [Nonomuraea pusilla]|uniref:ABC-type dipeptide/oligopeptide/nickel transport system, ATPase component n=1 Tax=Nonomuraea pusilla TaxID=46177 RepID=A0A1H7YL03_9ACTN|nr:ABC transporter ATP-binding protein [Nonomuraea pusilla]SEM46611.1 ABC-type dipeptide/oligopeptide/nickel transport system, ATPase component [Nonomuraea pusilla]